MIIQFVLIEPKVPENIGASDYRFERIKEKVSFLKSDDMNLMQSIWNILEGQITSKKRL